MQFHRSQVISLKNHPILTERWLQDQIIEDPTILGLGDVVVHSQERNQPKGGRLDLLLEDADNATRFEVELQLGTVDESHIIRTIEYWDLERKRYPQYDHVAVIVAEEITTRFFNVIGLFNGFIPLIAIQLNALQVESAYTLHATKVLDVQTLGTEDEDNASLSADRNYWESKSTREMLALVDEMISIAQQIDKRAQPKYNKFYVGIGIDGQANNFISFKPRRKHVCLQFKLPKSDSITERLEATDLQTLEYDKRWGHYRIQITKKDIDNNSKLILALMQEAYTLRNS